MEKYYDINKDNYSVRCKIYCNDLKKIKKIVLYGHGFGGHKDNHTAARFAGQLTSKYKNTGLIVFDWPCHGKDARKKLSLMECDHYITLLNEDIRERFGVDDIYVYATSYGGFLFLKYISDHGNPYRKIALRCPAINFYQSLMDNLIGAEELARLKKGKEILAGYDRKVKISMDFIKEVEETNLFDRDFIDYAEDLLLLHGTKDEKIPYQSSLDFSEKNIIELILSEGSDHRYRDPVKLDQASNDIMNFFDFNAK